MNALLKSLKIKKSPGLVEKWLGISLDEWQRAKDSRAEHIVHRYPLLDKRMSRADCLAWLKAHDLPSPGKSACVFCPFHSIRAWEEMKRAGGRDWEIALEVDSQIRTVRSADNQYVTDNGVRMFVHPARVPLAEAVQIPEDYGMAQADLFGPVEDDDAVTCDSGHCFL